MTRLPNDDEVAERITELGLDPRDPTSRAEAAASLQAEHTAPARPASQGITLCSSSAQLADGRIETVTTFYPAGDTAHEQQQPPAAS